jgi:secondary thiamine-phosphate synthase enzyme
MKVYTEVLELATTKKREFMNITPRVKAALEKSGLQDGILVVNSMHVNAAIFVNDEESGLIEDISQWAEQVAPHRNDYEHTGRFESNAAAHLQAILLNHQTIVNCAHGKLDLGPWQQVFFAELDGPRPRRVQIKILGE